MSKHSRIHAFTLIELVIAMSAGGVVMLLAIGMVHQAMLHCSSIRREAENLRTLDRLAAEFRRDAYQSDRFELTGPDVAEFQFADGRMIQYRVDQASVVRSEDLEEQGTRREHFGLEDRHRVVFQQSEGPQRALLTVSARTPVAGTERIERLVAATLGRQSVPVAFPPSSEDSDE